MKPAGVIKQKQSEESLKHSDKNSDKTFREIKKYLRVIICLLFFSSLPLKYWLLKETIKWH